MNSIELIVSWAATYLLHSTLIIGGVLVLRRVLRPNPQLSDRLWKAAAFGGIFTATAQLSAVFYSAGGAGGDVFTLSAAELMGVTAGLFGLGGLGLVALGVERRRMLSALEDRQPTLDEDLLAALETLRAEAGIRRSIRLTESDALSAPIALGRTEICLPLRAVGGLLEEQRIAMLAHELAHLERRDPFYLIAFAALTRVLWFQPLNRIARDRFAANAEFACDAWAARFAGGPLPMAQCLTEVAAWLIEPADLRSQHASQPFAAAMARRGSPLVERITRLLHQPVRSKRAERLTALCLVGLVGGVLSLAPTVSLADQRACPSAGAAVDTPGPSLPCFPACPLMGK